MLLWGLLFTVISSAGAQDFTSTLNFAGVFSRLSEGASCNTRASASLCRSLPWAPRLHEGVVENGSEAFIFLEADLPEGTEIARWSKKFSPATRAEMVSYFIINNPIFAQAMLSSPFTVAYIVMIKKVAGVYKIVSVGMNIASQLNNEVFNQYNVVQGEIEDTRGEWIPPLKFKMGHQFKLNDAI